MMNVPCKAWDIPMSSSKDVVLESCFVLHQIAYRDSSAIVEVFSRHHGRVGLVARGIKSPKSKLRGLLQPFTPLLVSWSGKGDLHSLRTAEAQGRTIALPGMWLMSGFYLNELLMRLLMRHDEHEVLYSQYEAALVSLSAISAHEHAEQKNREHQRILRLFEKALLEELGYGLVLDHDVDSGDPIAAAGRYTYFLEKGPVLSSNHYSDRIGSDRIASDGIAEHTDTAYIGSGLSISGESLLSLARGELQQDDALRECKQLMRAVLAGYLGSKPLRSRDMFIKGSVDQQGSATSRTYGD